MQQAKGFTLVELLVTIAIIGILSAVVLFSVIQYINSSKDASVRGNLSVLVTAGEVYYNTNQDSYQGFCNTSVVISAYNQIPKPQSNPNCEDGATPGLCCFVNIFGTAWAACSQEFSDDRTAYCVDSKGVQRRICNSSCANTIIACPEDNINSCP